MARPKKISSYEKVFSLTDLMVVLVIIGVLVLLALPKLLPCHEEGGRRDEWTEAIFTPARQSLNDKPGPFITLSFAREVQENS